VALLIAVGALCLAIPATAAADVAPYVIETSTGASIVPGTTDIGNHGDDTVTTISLPFPATFYGQTYTSAGASSNGNLQFTTTNTAFANSCLPATGFGASIMPNWDDLYLVNAGFGIFTSVTGVAPNRTFNIEWRAQYFPGSGSANFEIQLHEDSPTITVIYGNITNSGVATAGVEAAETGPFTQFACNGAGGPITAGLRVDYVPSRALHVLKGGPGGGTVTSADPGINCGATCDFNFRDGTNETLTAAPAAGSGFVDWTGCDNPSGATCTMAMNAARTVTANFDIAPLAFTASASAITLTGATVAGTVNGGSGPTTFHFDYGTDPGLAGASTTPATPAPPPNDADQQVSQALTGLKPGTRYYYRLDASNSAGSASGSIFNFKTPSLATALITKHPKKVIETSKPKAKATFAFGTAKAGAFQCKLDKKKFKACTSPKSYKVKPGKHKFSVRALTAGIPGKAAKFKFKVVRK
jgi:hypothetical protein